MTELERLAQEMTVVFPTYPRTQAALETLGMGNGNGDI